VTGVVDLIGTEKPPLESLIPQSTPYWYCKAVRPGRKLGHNNVIGEDHAGLLQQMMMLRQQQVSHKS